MTTELIQTGHTYDEGRIAINYAFSGEASFNEFSANTIYSASTNLYDIFELKGSEDITRVQGGSNITTGGTANAPTINLGSFVSINSLSVSGNSTFMSLSASTVSADTIYTHSISGMSPVNINNTVFDSGNMTSTTISTTSLSARTLFSASTNIENLFLSRLDPVVMTASTTFYVDNKRTDSYTENGTISRPFKTIMAAINNINARGDNAINKPYSININTGYYNENIKLTGNSLVFFTFYGNGSIIAPSSGYSIESLNNNDNLQAAFFYDLYLVKPIYLSGASNGTSFGKIQINIENCSILEYIKIHNTGKVKIKSSYSTNSTTTNTISNVTHSYIDNIGSFDGSFLYEYNSVENIPSGFNLMSVDLNCIKARGSFSAISNLNDTIYVNVELTNSYIDSTNDSSLETFFSSYTSSGTQVNIKNSNILGHIIVNGLVTIGNSSIDRGFIYGTGQTLYYDYAKFPFKELTYPTLLWDMRESNNVKTILSGVGETLGITNALNGSSGTIIAKQDGVGSRAFTFPAGSLTASTVTGFSTAANAVDIFKFTYDGTNYFWTQDKGFVST